MTGLRRHIAHHRTWAAWLFALALALRVLVPTGYMPDVSAGKIVIRLCDGAGPVPAAMTMPGMAHHGGGHDARHDHAGQPCAFAAATTAAIDRGMGFALAAPIILVARFIRALPVRGPPPTAHRPLPPSHAPPVHG